MGDNGPSTMRFENTFGSLPLCAALLLAALSPDAVARAQSGATPLSTTRIAARAVPASVTVLALSAAGDTISQGSGYVLRQDGVVVTNWHVLAGASRAIIQMQNGERFDRVQFFDGDSIADVVLLKVPGFEMPVLATDTRIPPIGSRVVVVGSPLGLNSTVSEGIVSALRIEDGRQLIQMSAPVSPGSSGGPVLNDQGRVIGITRSSIVAGQQLNFAVPSRYAVALLTTTPLLRGIAEVFSADQVDVDNEESEANASAPDLAATLRGEVVGVYLTRTTLRADSIPAREYTGWLVLGPEESGWFVVDGVARTLFVRGVAVTRTGRVAFSAGSTALEGYETDFGLYLEGIESSSRTAVSVRAELRDPPLAFLGGIYDASVTTQYRNGNYRGDNTLWQGTATVSVTADSVMLDLSLMNNVGGTTGAIAIAKIAEGGQFTWTNKEGTKRLTGRLTAGRLEAEWFDSRDGGAYYIGQLVGRRR